MMAEPTQAETAAKDATAHINGKARKERAPTPAASPFREAPMETALLQAQKAVQSIEKDAYNKFAGYWYTSAEKMVEECRKALHDAGLTVSRRSWAVRNDPALPSMPILVSQMILTHPASGDDQRSIIEYPVCEGKGKPMDKALSGALTTSLAYWLRDLLLIPRFEEEVDKDSGGGQQKPPAGKGNPTELESQLFTGDKIQMTTVTAWFQSFGYAEERAKNALSHFKGKTMAEVRQMIEAGAQKK